MGMVKLPLYMAPSMGTDAKISLLKHQDLVREISCTRILKEPLTDGGGEARLPSY